LIILLRISIIYKRINKIKLDLSLNAATFNRSFSRLIAALLIPPSAPVIVSIPESLYALSIFVAAGICSSGISVVNSLLDSRSIFE